MEPKKSKVLDIHRKSDFVLEVLEKTPSWILTWGNSFLLIFLLILICLTALISYPDQVEAKTMVTLDSPPINVIAEYSGEIEKIYYKDQSSVDYGDIVFKMYSRAKLEQVKILKDSLLKFQKDTTTNYYLEYDFPTVAEIGEITDRYSALIKEYRDFKFFLNQDIVFLKVKSLYSEIKRINKLNSSLNQQEKLFKKQFDLTEKNYERFSTLNDKGVISDSEKERLESEFLLESRSFENFKTSQINNEVEIERIKTTINDLIGTRKNELSIWKNKINEKVITVLDEIKSWEDKYLIKSPIKGTLAFDRNVVERYYVGENESLFYVIPSGSNKIVGISEMPVRNSGGITIGSEAQIRLDAYPYREFGFIKATVKEISLVPKATDSGYVNLVELQLENPMRTVNDNEVPFSANMTGIAIIIKKKQSILERVFDRIGSVFDQ